jgi:hypothetical protein
MSGSASPDPTGEILRELTIDLTRDYQPRGTTTTDT